MISYPAVVWSKSRSVVSDSLQPMDCSSPDSSVCGILQALLIVSWLLCCSLLCPGEYFVPHSLIQLHLGPLSRMVSEVSLWDWCNPRKALLRCVFPCFFVVNLFAFIVVVIHVPSSFSFLHQNVHCLEGALGLGFLIVCFKWIQFLGESQGLSVFLDCLSCGAQAVGCGSRPALLWVTPALEAGAGSCRCVWSSGRAACLSRAALTNHRSPGGLSNK